MVHQKERRMDRRGMVGRIEGRMKEQGKERKNEITEE